MSKVDCLFVHPGDSEVIYQQLSTKFSAIEPPTWALLLAQSCRSKGYNVAILDCDAERLSYEESVKRIIDIDPRLVCFVVYGQNPNAGTTKMTGAVGLAQCLKEAHSYPVCFVGSHTSSLPLEVLAFKSVDFVLLNEGVYALHNLLATDLKTDLGNIKGIGWKDKGMPRLNEPQGVVPQSRMDIDLPGYAWDLLPYKEKPLDLYRSCNWHANYIESNRTPYAALYTSLGCAFSCTFCLDQETRIIVSNGRIKRIKDINKSDKILSFNTEKLEIVESTVIEKVNRQVDEILFIELDNGRKIKSTSEHPFFVEGKWINAGDLKVGDKCLVIEPSDKMSFWAKNYNSNRLPGVAQKSWQTKVKNGQIPFMCTDIGRKKISEAARKRALSSDNPMFKEENRKKASLRMRGCKNPAWKGGISKIYQQYPVEFSKRLKKKVKIRDNYTCQECGEFRKGKKLDIHHIDYDKNNNILCNLICLCSTCHTKTNFDRDKWTPRYKEKMLTYDNCPHYVTIKRVEKIKGDFKVYNIRCEPYNNFFAEYILTHNCMINIVNRTDNSDGITAADSRIMRFWSPEFIIKEFDKLANMGVKTVRISDEMFLLNSKYYEPLVRLLIEKDQDFNCWSYARVDTVKNRYLDLLKKAGINWLALGVESVDQKIRQEITKGSYREVDIRRVIKDIEEAGLYTIANYIFGLPDDNYDSMNATLDAAIELNTETVNMYPCFALPGSSLYYQAKQKGWALPQSFESWSFHSFDSLPLPTHYLSAADVMRFRDRAWELYFKRTEYLDMIEKKFGTGAKNHIIEMSSIKLKRKLLET
jgi:radical SAM superfamily enzyme YgiQ (UPF0313 family)/5-methylcytosine-specific restriction endonuclease McrA